MEIVDSQIHEPHPAAPWPFGNDSELIVNVELAREAMDSAGVDVAIANARPEFCDAAVARYPERFGSCPFVGKAMPLQPSPAVALDDPDMDATLAAFRNQPGRLALRAVIRRFKDGQLTEDFEAGRFEPFLAAAERHGVPVFVQASGHMEAAAGIARAHPDLVLIIDHLGLLQHPSETGDQPWSDLDSVLALAELPNTAVKLTGACTVATRTRSTYPYEDLWPYLNRLVEAFTPDRLVWASDYTRLRNAATGGLAPRKDWFGSYAEQLHFISDTNELSTADKEKILGQSLRRLLRWPAQAPD